MLASINPIFPSYDSLDEFLEFGSTRLPIESDYELYWLTQVIKNTVIKELQ